MTTNTHPMKMRAGLMKDTRGGFVEEVIIIGVVCLLSIAAFTVFGKDIQAKIKSEGTAVTQIQQ